MTKTETRRPLDKALNFNMDNIFEYISQMLFNLNVDMIGDQARETVKGLCQYIASLPVPDVDSAVFEVESLANTALAQTSDYVYKAGFIEACRLLRTLQSF